MVLIVGGESQIGTAVARRLASTGKHFGATSRRANAAWPLDFARDASDWQLPICEAAVFCAAVTSLAVCEAKSDYARRVNVAGPATLAAKLHAAGAHVVFLSTNLVFDGSKERPMTRDPVCPTTIYGRSKAEAERAILEATEGQASVLRLTKVLSDQSQLLLGWRKSLAEGRPIEAFLDMPVAPVGISQVAAAVLDLLERKPPGLFHLSACDDSRWFDLAQSLCATWGYDLSAVRGARAADQGLSVPAHSALGMGEAEALLGWRPASFQDALQDVFSGAGHQVEAH